MDACFILSINTSVQKVVVLVDVSTFKKTTSGSITGITKIQIDHASFPDANWNDFPVAILSCWLEPVNRILQGQTRVWECRFMDGPALIHLEQLHDDVWNLLCLRKGKVELVVAISCRAFIQNLLDAARQVLHECQLRGWQNRDIETLDSAVRMIQFG